MNKVLLSFCMFVSCLSFTQCAFKKPTTAEQCESAIYSTIAKSRKVLSKRYNMDAVACGLGMPSAVAHKIDISFKINKPLNLEQILPIVIDCVDEIVLQANANKQLRPFMRDYPFTYENVTCSVGVLNSDGSMPKAPHVNGVNCFYGDFSYTVWEKDKLNDYPYPGTFEELNKKYTPYTNNLK